MRLFLLFTFAFLLTFMSQASENSVIPIPSDKIDALFAEWDKPDSPGCALGVIRDGQLIYSRGYGSANLEYRAPITSHTPFHLASVSKQFTAFAVQLLAAEGKLALDDDVRKYLPELHDFGKTITLRHLIHHTSGLRDQWEMLVMAGWRIEDVITQGDILRLAFRQRALNFEPGSEYLYSNTGYTLLAEIVRRVSGKTLREFTDERIFQPLGMTSTHFHNDAEEVVEGRAYSYNPRDGGFRRALLNFSNEGATSLFSTVEDLARWDQNFYDGKVGGPAVLAAMHEKGKLKDGQEIFYASGLAIGQYKGLNTVDHAGMDAGFRSFFVRFPEQRFSVIVLANLGGIDTGRLAHAVADLFLEGEFKPDPPESAPPPEPPKVRPVKVKPKRLKSYPGEYWFGPGFERIVTLEGDRLYVRAPDAPRVRLLPVSETEFIAEDRAAVRYSFKRIRRGKALQVLRRTEGETRTGDRMAPISPKRIRGYEGSYYSDELGVLFTITARRGALRLRNLKHETRLEPKARDRFESDWGEVRVTRDRRDRVSGFTLTSSRSRNVAFRKVKIKP